MESHENLTDWGFKSLFPNLKPGELNEIFNSEEFWSIVKANEDFAREILYGEGDMEDMFNWAYITKGDEKNLKIKYDLLSRFHDFTFYGLSQHEKKEQVRMSGCIQVDDNWENLKDTDAELKILLKNHRNTDYNDVSEEATQHENLYIANTMAEVFEILRFIALNESEGDSSFFNDLTTEMDETLIPLQELYAVSEYPY